MTPDIWKRIEGALVYLVALHSAGVGILLLFFTEWGLAFGGWEPLSTLFFTRQGGVFHLLFAAAYVIEYRRYGGVAILVMAKTTAVVFLAGMMLAEPTPRAVPLCGLADGAMALVVAIAHRRAGRRL